MRRERREASPRRRAAGRRVGNDADAMAARGLGARQIDDVAEQPADRRAQDVQDVEAPSAVAAIACTKSIARCTMPRKPAMRAQCVKRS